MSESKGRNPREWMKGEEAEHLPDFLKDFHDQKDFFKTMWASYKTPKGLEAHTWVSNHIYTVDIFLWYCGIHGYTLQKSRKQGIAFEDLQAKIHAMKNEDSRRLAAVLGLDATKEFQGEEAKR